MSAHKNPFQQSFPYSPYYSTWEEWNGNLIMWYSQEPIAHVDEDAWKSVANQVAALPTFSAYPVPTPDTYDDWREWAKEFRLIINGTSH